MKRLIAFTLSCAAIVGAAASDFTKHFNDSTLRIDYKFCADAGRPAVYSAGMSITPGWHGRRAQLTTPLLGGNGAIYVIDKASGDTIYRNTFSSLYHEWLVLDEAREGNRSFDNSFVVPQPINESLIDIEIFNANHEVIARSRQHYRPADYLIRRPSRSAHPVVTVHEATYGSEPVDIAILAEGYTAAEMPIFYEKARAMADDLLRYKPFSDYADRFNIIAVGTPSADSGVTVPKEGKWLNTAFDSHFSTFDSDRYLTTESITKLHEALNGLPYEEIVVLANTPLYGGGGIYNSYMLTADKTDDFLPVAAHEFGHSFAGLGDEYFYEGDVMDDTYPTSVEPWEPNITTLVDFDSKWASLLAKGTPIPTPVAQKDSYPVGVYEGAAYSFHGLYRPADECRMRNTTTPDFCPACQRAIAQMILHLTAD